MKAGDLLRAALEALARADAEELARLAETEATPPRTAAERREALALHHALGKLLSLTRRNLWLLRGVYRDPCGYGPPRE